MTNQNRRAGTAILVIAVVMLISSCVDPPEYEEIDKLRILAVRSDKPQLTLGEIANVDALVVTPDDAPVTLRWQLCAYVGSADTKRACPKEALIQKGNGDAFSFEVSEPLLALLEPFCKPDESLLKRLPEGAVLPECGDAGYPLVIRLTAESGKETQVAVKRVLAARDLGESRLENPIITGFHNLPTDVRPNETYTFSVAVEDPESSPTGPGLESAVDMSSLRYTWFLRGADVDYMQDMREQDAPERVHLKIDPDAVRVSTWIVVRNTTYGVDWERLDLHP